MVRPKGIAERGGYTAINKRIQEGLYLPEDIKAGISRVNDNADTYKRKQQELSRGEDRGGSSR